MIYIVEDDAAIRVLVNKKLIGENNYALAA